MLGMATWMNVSGMGWSIAYNLLCQVFYLCCPGVALALLLPLAANRNVKRALAIGAMVLGLQLLMNVVTFSFPEFCNRWNLYFGLFYSSAAVLVRLYAFTTLVSDDCMEPAARPWVGLIVVELMSAFIFQFVGWSSALVPVSDVHFYFSQAFSSGMYNVFMLIWCGLATVAYYRLAHSGIVAGCQQKQSAQAPANRLFLRVLGALLIAVLILWAFSRYAAPVLGETLDWKFMRLL